jgi:predicted RND superfamily exporter protein
MSLTPIEIVAIIWGIVTAAYVALFLYRSIVGMKEEDTLYLSAGEARLEAEQREVMKHITKLDSYSHKIGYTSLALTVILAGMWIYSVARELL